MFTCAFTPLGVLVFATTAMFIAGAVVVVLVLGLSAIAKARPEDVPQVMTGLANIVFSLRGRQPGEQPATCGDKACLPAPPRPSDRLDPARTVNSAAPPHEGSWR